MNGETKKHLQDATWRIGEKIVGGILVTLALVGLGILLGMNQKRK